MPSPRDNHMIMQGHPEALPGRFDGAGDLDVGVAWRGIARGMVVNHHERAGVELKRALDDLARLHRRLVHRAHALLLGDDQAVLAVQKQDMEALTCQMSDGRAAIIQHLVPRIENLALMQVFARLANAGLVHDFDQPGDTRPGAVHQDDVRAIGCGGLVDYSGSGAWP